MERGPGSGDRRPRHVLIDAVTGWRWLLGVSGLAMVVATVAYAVSVRIGGEAVDVMLAGDDARGAVLAALALAITGALSWSVSDVGIARVATVMSVRLRAAMVRHTLSLPVGFFTERSAGEVTDRISTDVDTISSGIVNQLKPIGMGALGALAAFAVSVTVDLRLTLLFLPLAAVVVQTGRGAARQVADRSRELQAEWADAAGTAEEAFGAREDLRQVLGRGLVMRRWAEHAARLILRKRAMTIARNRLTLSSVGALRSFQVLVLIGGARLASSGEVGIGDVWAAIGLVTLFSRRIEEVLASLQRVSEFFAATQRVAELLDEEPEPVTIAPPPPRAVRWDEPVSVTFEGVSFAYDDGPEVLHDIRFGVRAGRTLALVGRTGSGKSTLAKLVNRAVSTPPGRVFIDGVDVGAIPVDELRRNVGVVSQRVELIGASLRDNITLFDPSIADETIVGALGHLGMDAWLADQPDGLDTRLGDGARVLSAGEEQLVAYARLLVRNPAVVLLDEATARLDPATEQILQRATERLLAGRTSIIIAHRLATVTGADDVVVLDDGRVLEHGQRRALLADTGSAFHALVAASGHVPVLVTSNGGAAGRADPTPERPNRRRTEPDPDRVATEKVSVATVTRRLLWRHRPALLPGLAGWAVFFTLPAIGAWVWSNLIGELGPDGDARPMIVLFAAAAAVGLLGRIVGEAFFSRWWLLSNITLRSNLLAAQLHPTDHRAGRRPRSPGDAISRMWDTDSFIQYVDHWVDLGCMTLFLLFATALSGRWSTLPILVAPIALPALGAVLFRRPIEEVAIDHARVRGEWSGRVAEVCAAATTIKGFGAEAHVERHLDELTRTRQGLALRLRHQELAVFGSVFLVAEGGQRLILLWLANAIASGAVATDDIAGSVGGAVAAAESLALMPIGGIIACMLLIELPAVRAKLGRFQRLLPVDRDFDITTAPEDLHLPPRLVRPVPTSRPDRERILGMELLGGRVVYPDGTHALDGVDLSIRRGELVIVTGPIASGKSTLLRVLAGLCPLTDGRLLWGGEEVVDPSRFLRPPNCSFVAQSPRLISGTIDENVSLDHDVDVGAALRLAELDRDVERAGGLHAIVGHRGLRLSGGQVQRLATARATAGHSELLVVDDLSSALDVVTERQLWQNLRDAGQTVIATSYKRSALELADQIVVLREGRIDAVGGLDDLERSHGHLFA